jgi:hypothetical protein
MANPIAYGPNTTASTTTAAPAPGQQRVAAAQARAQQDATRIAQLTPDQVKALQAYQNRAVADIDQLQNQTVANTGAAGLLDSFRELQAMRALTTPTAHDNDTARDVKQGYQNAYLTGMRDQAQAARLMDKYGPGGPYPQSDGSQVQIEHLGDAKGYRVQITSPDGSKTTIQCDGDAVSSQRTDADGKVLSTLQKSGSWVQQGVDGGKTTTYQEQPNGQPQRMVAGPPDNVTETTNVNPDGSTDTTRERMIDPSRSGESVTLGTKHEPARPKAA